MNKCTECGNDLDYGICMCEDIASEAEYDKLYNRFTYNKYTVIQGILYIAIYNSNGEYTGTVQTDDKFIGKASGYQWGISNGYARSTCDDSIMFHRLIMDCQQGMVVDHINHDKLDNRRSNLRICTQQQNTWNSKVSARNTSGYTGVTWNSNDKRWAAFITVNGKYVYLGQFKDIDDAIAARKAAEAKYFGEFAYKPGL